MSVANDNPSIDHKFYVIGSGPSGVAVAWALVNRGFEVVMLDYGNSFSAATLEKLDAFKGGFDGKLEDKLRNELQFNIDSDMPTKKYLNDDFVFKDSVEKLSLKNNNLDFTPSLAIGGLSNVWGAGVLPYIESDMNDWPITRTELAPHYKALHAFLPLSAVKDDLELRYPLYASHLQEPKTSAQATQLLAKMQKKRGRLAANGMSFGHARVAYHADRCTPCSMCLYGCPTDLIYSSRQTVELLKLQKNFSYIKNIFVNKFKESTGEIEIICTTASGEEQIFHASKLFLACGCVSTTEIVLKSLDYKKPITLKENPYFMFPLVDFRLKGDFTKNQYNTLLQLFVEIEDSLISDKTVHLGIYGYNNILDRYLAFKYGALYKVSKPLLKYFLNKTHLIQGFFHSDMGNDIRLQWDGRNLNLFGEDHPVDNQIKQIMRKFKLLGMTSVYTKAKPGRSYHIGCSLPMTKNGGILTTDTVGLLNGFKNVHIVDASILPSIPAETVTYTVMANAHRIGSLV